MTKWGVQLARLRERRGLTQGELAKLVSVDRPYLSRIESGQRNAPGQLVAACDRALEAGGELILAHASSVYGCANLAHSTSNDGVAADGGGSSEYVDRRAFLAALTGTAIAGAAGLLSDHTDQVAHFHRIRVEMGDADDLIGARALVPRGTAQIQKIDSIIRADKAQPGLDVLHAELHEFMAWLHQDQRDWTGANAWSDRALHLAIASGDANVVAHVLARKAHIAGDRGDGRETVQFAHAAVNAAPEGCYLSGIALAHGAHGHALLGDHVEAERWYERAYAMAPETADLSVRWGRWLDHSYINVHRARSLAALGNHAAAAPVFDRTVAGFPDRFARDKAVYLVRSALAHAGAGDPERAAAIGTKAVTVGASTGSARIAHGLQVLRTRLEPARNTRAVVDFRDSLRAVSV